VCGNRVVVSAGGRVLRRHTLQHRIEEVGAALCGVCIFSVNEYCVCVRWSESMCAVECVWRSVSVDVWA
jgi:hypothetical protein